MHMSKYIFQIFDSKWILHCFKCLYLVLSLIHELIRPVPSLYYFVVCISAFVAYSANSNLAIILLSITLFRPILSWTCHIYRHSKDPLSTFVHLLLTIATFSLIHHRSLLIAFTLFILDSTTSFPWSFKRCFSVYHPNLYHSFTHNHSIRYPPLSSAGFLSIVNVKFASMKRFVKQTYSGLSMTDIYYYVYPLSLLNKNVNQLSNVF